MSVSEMKYFNLRSKNNQLFADKMTLFLDIDEVYSMPIYKPIEIILRNPV